MRTYILSDSEHQATQVRYALTRRGFECPADRVLPLADYPRLAEARPELVVLCVAPDPDRALIALREASLIVKSPVLTVGPGDDPKLILRCFRAGAKEFVAAEELATEIDEALARLQTDDSGLQVGKMFAVLGASGGSGASTIAVNVAAALARDHGGSILIDLKLETGDLAGLLDLRPRHTIADLCNGHGSPDREMFEQSLAAHESGVRLLASPRRQASTICPRDSLHGAAVGADGVRELFVLARGASPHTVVEVSPTFRDEQTQALRMADVILLVFRLDFTSLRNTRRILEHLDATGIDRSRVRLVGSRHGQPHSLAPADAEEALGLKVFHLVPDDPKAVNVSTNAGEPVVLGFHKSPSAKSLQKLAAALSGPSK